jgi:ASPIC and UnbV/Fibronectin type III domain
VRVLRPGTSSLIAWREAKNVYGYLSQDDPVLHVGLGSARTVDVEVTFLDGTRVTRTSVASNQTVTINGATGVEPPSAPRNLTATVAGSSVTIRWEAPATGSAPTGYIVEAGSAAGTSDLAVVPTGGTTFNASAPNGTYFVRVKARNSAGTGPASTEVVVRVGSAVNPPQAPVGLAFTIDGSLVRLNWTAPAQGDPAASYLLEVGSQPGITDLLVVDNITGTTLSATGPPGRYFVRVRGRNAGGLGPPSNEVIIQIGG